MTIDEFVEKFHVKLPRENWSSIVILDEESGDYRYSQPIECEKYPGFFYVPGFEQRVISREGVMISLSVNRLITWGIWKDTKGIKKGGYRTSFGMNNSGERKYLPRHRALALAFLLRRNKEESIVNHINGTPGDDRLENLEWCTYSQNNKHAYDSDLYRIGKVIPVVYKNRFTGETCKFRTVADCVRKLNKTEAYVQLRIRKPELEFDDGIDIKKDDGQPWPVVRKQTKVPQYREIVSRNVFTGHVCIYRNSREAERATGVKDATIEYHCVKEIFCPTKGFNFRYFSSENDFPVHTEKNLQMFRDTARDSRSLGIVVTDETGLEIDFYTNIKSASRSAGKTAENLRRIITQKILVDGKRYRFHDLSEGSGRLRIADIAPLCRDT